MPSWTRVAVTHIVQYEIVHSLRQLWNCKLGEKKLQTRHTSCTFTLSHSCTTQYVLLDILEMVGLVMATYLFLQQLARGEQASQSQP